ncbi:gamma-glutamyltransferase family protein [Solimonas marina]|uniref:Gamma-glutamyltransferase family protein n=1 Tax=Solimonas marina TaxID=2714601 RepID=A0A969WB65_9GAMM|nr:gamma-glutamyltransferase family protein [Solimonas marina]NKF22885.1 gamma-glutamyltransferase family protein [Solimonas marina]
MRNFQQPTRSAIYCENGVVATSLPEATTAGLEVLRAGGSAADAAVAAAAVLAVAEPQNAGFGGDSFYIHARADGTVSAYNGSGRTPAALDPEAIGEIGFDSAHAVTVPGAVDALLQLHTDHCRLPLDRLLAPATALAEQGYLVQPRVAWDWQMERERLARSPTAAPMYDRAVRPGDRVVQPALAATLRAIAADGRRAFYEGAIADGIVATLRALGGTHTAEDFARHRGQAVEPIRTRYRDHDILECPPNGQGMAVLIMLNLLSALDMPQVWRDPVAYAHLLAQVSVLAYRERTRWAADPDFTQIPLQRLLSAEYADELRPLLASEHALTPALLDETPHKDTVYLSCVDRDGNAVSFINSIFTDFGSAIYDARSGLLLHNRGASFSREPGHPNALAPLKRPMHTIIPGMAMRDGRPVMPFGVMGGHYQATGQVQFLSALLDLGLDPQQALELPRHFCFRGVLEVEETVPQRVREALAAKGYVVRPAKMPIGGGQAIYIDHARGVLIGGSDPRKDGLAGGY